MIGDSAPAPSLFLEIFAGVAVLGFGGFFAFIARRFKTIDDLYAVMATRKPTDLEPHPPLGFIDQLESNTKETRENSAAVLAMATRFGQQNGTVLEIQKDVAVLHSLVADIAGKPPASVAEVKKAVAQEHEASEARQAEILGAIKSDTMSLVDDSHPDGGDSSRDVLNRIDVATQRDEPLES
jgi:hypothetical protein